MNILMLRAVSVFVALCMVPAVAFAFGTVKGTTKDKQTNESLIGATIRLNPVDKSKRTVGTVSRPPNGEFSVAAVPPGEYNLEVSYTGYKRFTKKISVANDQEVNLGIVGLIADIFGTEEVVVTGVGSRNDKSVVATAVTKLDATALREQQGFSSVDQLMTGKIPGVQIQQSSGNVGGGFSFQVRGGGGLTGSNQPLIFIDGIRVTNTNRGGIGVGGQNASALADINMEDIESMEILKGAAGAALYGSQAQNGVVLITTKRAKSNMDYFGIDFTAIGGWNEQALEYSADQIFSYREANEIFRRGPFDEFSLRAEGRSGNIGYFVGYNKRFERGIMENNNFNRETVRANLSARPTQDLTLNLQASYTWSTNQRPHNDNNVQGWLANTILVNPGFTRNFNNPSPGEIAHPTYRYINHQPQAIRDLNNYINNTRILASLEASYTPAWLKGLQLRAVAGYDGDNVVSDQIRLPIHQYPGIGRDGDIIVAQEQTRRVNFDLSASYTTEITDDIVSTTIFGGQLFDNFSQSLSGTTTEFTSERVMLLGAGTRILGTGNGLGWLRTAGYFLRQEFAFLDNTYAVNLGFRQDYQTVVDGVSNAIFYPNVGVMTRLDKMGFLPSDINLFKLRVSYGQSGSLPGITAADPLRWGVNRTGIGSGAVISSRGNPGIEPERTSEIELGFDFEFDNRYGIEFTYISTRTDNTILPVPEAPSTGLPGLQKNIGGTNTSGFESRIYATPIRTQETELTFSFIWNYFDESIREFPVPQTGLFQFRPGFQRSSMFAPVVVGGRFQGGEVIPVFDSSNVIVDPVTGQIDIRQFVGNTIPLHTGAFSVNFRFLKDFTFYAMAEWKLDFFIFNQNREFQINATRQTLVGTNAIDDVNDVEYTRLQLLLGMRRGSSFLPGILPLRQGTPEFQEAVDRMALMDPSPATRGNLIEPGDFLRIREMSLSYDATDVLREWLGPDYIRRVQFTASVRNLMLFTKYSFDPEVNGLGYDFLTLQNPRTYTFRMDYGF